jgi:SnoaL-like domain
MIGRVIGCIIVLLWGCVGTVTSQTTARTLAEQRLANVRQAVLINKGNYRQAINTYTDDVVYEDPVVNIVTKQKYLSFLEQLWSFSPEYELTISDEVYDGGDTYMCYWIMEGRSKVKIWFISSEVEYSALGLSIARFRPGEAQVYFQRDQYSEGGESSLRRCVVAS